MPHELRYEVNRPDVVDESVDQEVLIVHLGTGVYYSSRGAGDVAWQLLAAGLTSLETADAMGRPAGQVEEFLARLVGEELVRPRSGEPEGRAAIDPQGGPLVLEKYTDMQELLLLDPIHEVEEEGWPRARAGAPEN